jgi:hypothetical protein
VDTEPRNREVRDWTRFKEMSQLRKSDDILEEHFLRLVNICQDLIDRANNGDTIPDEKDVETMTPDKAKKLLKRVEWLRKLREHVVTNPQVS